MTSAPPDQPTSMPSQPKVSPRGVSAFVASRGDAPANWFYGTLWVVLADVHQIIVGLATPAARRELPPEDLALPSEDVLTRMNNNYWSASSDSSWSKVAPQR
jgi:hypothetical protein